MIMRVQIMKKYTLVFIVLGISLFELNANAQTLIVKLWPDSIPGSISCSNYTEQRDEDGCIEKVSSPEMSVYLPSDNKVNNTAILICPGGAYSVVSYENEGIAIAQWLNKQGIAGFVLKYRLPSDKIMKDKSIGPLQDAQMAMRMIRSNAMRWHINPAKVGVMGFSAGGHLAAILSTHYDAKIYNANNFSARPDFTILVYPLISFDSAITHKESRENLIGQNPDNTTIKYFSADQLVTLDTAPAFLIHSADDNCVTVKHSFLYFQALQKNKIPAEIHVYQNGGHGYGLAKDKGTTSTWPSTCLLWLKANGWI